MPMSNYPKGFSAGLCVQNLPILNTYAGNIFWVDSGAGSNGNKGTFAQPFETLDYAVGRCTANNGDIIICKPGHTETVTEAGGLDLDVAGINIVFMGEGDDKATIQFTTDADADMDVDAENITLINPRFVAGIDALTGPIDVNAADFTIKNAEYHDAEDICTTDALIADSDAPRLEIDGWKFFKANEGGTQKESHFQCDGVDNLTLKNICVEGDFAAGIFETGADECLGMQIDGIQMKNTNATGQCFLMDPDNTGWAKNVQARNAKGLAANTTAKLHWVVSADAVPQCVGKPDGIVADNTTDDLFIISGGPVRAKITGLVTTEIGGAADMKLQITTDDPAATVDLNAGAVAIDADAVGTVYNNIGATSVFTPSSGFGYVILDPVTEEETEFILAPGTVKAHSSAAQDGVIAWYMTYTPLSPGATVVAA